MDCLHVYQTNFGIDFHTLTLTMDFSLFWAIIKATLKTIPTNTCDCTDKLDGFDMIFTFIWL